MGQDEFRLVLAWLIAAVIGRSPYPILVAHGEQGSGKSCQTRLIRTIVDPAKVPLRSPPRDERDLVIAAQNGAIVGFDNLSKVPPRLSDGLCRLSTGGGYGTRKLYTDGEEHLFEGTRPVIVNGIGRVIEAPDLQDRGIFLHHPVLPDENRRTEADLLAEFRHAHPRILGGLLDAAARVLHLLPDVEVRRPPRMADFACVGVATEKALGWPEGSFLAAYGSNRAEAVEAGIEDDPVAIGLRSLLADRAEWSGSATELLEVLEDHVQETVRRSGAWPKAPSALGKRLDRLAPSLRAVGIEFERHRDTYGRHVTLQKRDSAVIPVIAVTDPDVSASGHDGMAAPPVTLPVMPSPPKPRSDADDGNDGTFRTLVGEVDPVEREERLAIQLEGETCMGS